MFKFLLKYPLLAFINSQQKSINQLMEITEEQADKIRELQEDNERYYELLFGGR